MTVRSLGILAFSLALAACATTPKPDTTTTTHQTPDTEPEPDTGPTPEPAALIYAPAATLSLCPRLNVSNAPATAEGDRITAYNPWIQVKPGVVLMTAPARGACLTSGYGIRGGSNHFALDFQSKPADMVFAAGSGKVLEAGFRRDFGNYVLIDHGNGVYTRYSHLAERDAAITEGATIAAGMPLGLMGSTGRSTAIHLHYEILLGDYDNPKRSFGLTPADPFSFPAARPAS